MIKYSPLYLAIGLLLSGCNESNDPNVQTGIFVDGLVNGVSYQTATQSGVTNTKGEFSYIDGESVTFKLGATTLGTLAAKAMVTPLDFDSNATRTNLTPKVTNIAQFLQTLDSDLDPNNGIQITEATRTALNTISINLAATDFTAELNARLPEDKRPSKTAISQVVAREHLQTTLANYGLATKETISSIPTVAEVTRYGVDTSAVDLDYNGAFVNNFAAQNNKLKLGIGSGLGVLEEGNGIIKLVTITDRGPNLDAPTSPISGNTDGYTYTASKIFPLPTYTPRFATIHVTENKAELDVKSVTMLKNQANQVVSGRPLLPGTTGATGEVAIAENLAQLTGDINGLDPEGIVKDAQGNFWISDEYGPFIIKLDSTGKELARYAPNSVSGAAMGTGLPAIVQQRNPNRGMEGIAFSPEGMVYGLVQSPLVTTENGKTTPAYKKGAFLRLVELNPADGTTKTFAIPTKAKTGASIGIAPKDVKAGDLVALGNGKFLMIEQGKDLKGTLFNDVTLIDITGATDLNTKDAAYSANMSAPTSKSVEELVNYDPKATDTTSAIDTKATARDALFTSNGIKAVSKTQLFNLRDLGWLTEKAEGLAILADKQTLFVINDNDFGVNYEITGGCSAKQPNLTKYGVIVGQNGAAGSLVLNDSSCTASQTVVNNVLNDATERQTRLWKIKLTTALQ
jgi:hypothetical protein